MKKNYVFLCLLAFTHSLSAQSFSIARLNLNATGTLTTYHVAGGGSPSFSMANLGTFNPSTGQTLKISGRYVKFSTMGSPCQLANITFSYELYKDIATPVLVASGYGINVPILTNTPPTTEWKIPDGSPTDVNLVTVSTPNGDYSLRVKYDYSISFGPGPCMAGGSGSTGWVSATFGVNSVLAVETTTVTARKQSNNEIGILWKTAKEKANHGFQIERSADGENFSSIGEIKGAINSTVEKTYNFTDASPLQGINYYRIKNMDLSGKETMSKVVSVNFSNSIKTKLQAFPNPTYGALQLDVISEEESTKTLQVLDLAGRIILTQNAAITKGLNNISLNTEALSAGTYVVKLGSDVSRFVKM